MEAVYLSHYAIPELGVQPGDHLVVQPAHPTVPLQVVRNLDRHALVRLMGAGHLARLVFVAGDLGRKGPSSPPREPRFRHLQE